MGNSELERTNGLLQALADTMRALAGRTTDYQRVLDTVAERSVHYVCDGCLIALVSEDGLWMRLAAAHHRDEPSMRVARALLEAAPIRVDGSGQAPKVVRTGKAVLVPHVEPEDLVDVVQPQYVDLVRQLGIHSFLFVPLRGDGRVLGVLVLFRSGTAPPFTDEDEVFAGHLADLAGLVISNAQLLRSAQREIEDRKRAEQEALRFLALIQHSSDFIAMASLDRKVLFVNEAGRALVGLDRERDVTQLVLTDFHTESGMKRIPLLVAEGRWQGEGQLRHFGTGALIDVHVSSFLVRDAKGQPFGYATVQRDIRATKALEAQLRHAQKMEAVGRLAGGVAHDFNNVLSVILSYGELIAAGLEPGHAMADDIHEIIEAGKRAAGLTRQLLMFSRKQVLAPTLLDLNRALAGMDKMLRRLLGEDVELVSVAAPSLPLVKVDAGSIEQVIMNLAVNARDAMPAGGKLTIETASVVLDDGYVGLHVGVSPGPYVMLAISDSGVGMDRATQARIFEPFFTTKDPTKGTGLGLSTVFGIVEQSGGDIWVYSEPGRGTTFKVYLPQADGTVVAPTARAEDPARVRGTETILLAEDDPQVRAVAEEILRRHGYQVVVACDGAEALRRCAEHPAPIHLLLTDVVLPQVSGAEVMRQVVAQRPDIKVLCMSGYTDDSVVRHGVLEARVAFLQKPFTSVALARKVRGVLDA
jgi:PAS domain S-box-containing protein